MKTPIFVSRFLSQPSHVRSRFLETVIHIIIPMSVFSVFIKKLVENTVFNRNYGVGFSKNLLVIPNGQISEGCIISIVGYIGGVINKTFFELKSRWSPN